MLKIKKARDEDGWSNEMIKYGGQEMCKSLKIMMNRILKEEIIPEQWKKMRLKSNYKNKVERKDMSNRRGIFITNKYWKK